MKHIFTILLVFCTLRLFAQENFTPGWITTLKGDTIKGFIDDREWDINPRTISFKNQAGEIKTISPLEISTFGTAGGNHYKSAITAIDNNLKDEIINGKVVAKSKVDTLFLQVLIRGPLTLYKIKTPNEKVHFFIEKNGKLAELTESYRLLPDPADNVSKLFTVAVYKNILQESTQDCPNVQNKIKGLQLQANALYRFTAQYNTCISGKPSEYSRPVEKTRFRLGLVAGVSLTKIQFSPMDGLYSSVNQMARNNFPASISPTLGLSLLIILPRAHNKYGINTELLYKHISTQAGGYEMNLSYVRLNIAYRYSFYKKKMLPFIQGGLSTSLAFNSKADGMTVNLGLGGQEDGFRKFETGFFLGSGTSLTPRITAELRVERSNGISNFPLLKTPVTSVYILFSVRINKN